jgi:hypothetical protein
MIMGLFKEVVSWLVSLTEVGLAIAAMLLIGLGVGMAVFWMLGRFLSKLGGPPDELGQYAELGPYEDELEEMAAHGNGSTPSNSGEHEQL